MVLGAVGLFALYGGCSPQSKADPAQRLVEGWNFYRAGEFNPATDAFQQAHDAASTPALRQQALYGLATTWNLRRPGEDPQKAQALYEQLIAADPKGDLAAWSTLALARMKHLVPVGQEPDYPAVRAAYQKVIDGFPEHPAAEEAFVYQQATLVATLKEDDAKAARTALEGYLKQHPQNHFRSPMYSLISTCCQTLKESRARLDAELKAFETREVDPTNPNMENTWAYWNIATIAEFEVGDFAVARDFYTRFVKEYPSDQRTYGAQTALKRMDEMEAKIRAEAQGGTGRATP